MEKILLNESFEIKRIPLFTGTIMSVQVNHEGKYNHIMEVSFKILETNALNLVNFYILTPEQFEDWMVPNEGTSARVVNPKKFFKKVTKIHSLVENVEIEKNTRYYFAWINSLPNPTKIKGNILVKEKWEPIDSKPLVYSSSDLANNSLSKKIREMISTANKNLKIISPYTDLHLIEEFLNAVKLNVEVLLIIRNDKDFQTHDTKVAFPRLQKLLQKNLKTNSHIHARLIIKDGKEAMLMTSDLQQESMQNLINCGIFLKDTKALADLIDFFNEVWNSSKNTS